ncbi:MAG: B12-binding domain-containing radical SAM protein [Candidatus Gastranaerophilales bacterium]|nr:B12-binding domain-containing radical SAM protein [Candidatus Gastranaerophilales bacterium]
MKKIFLIYPPSVQMNRTARCQQPVKELIVLPPLPPSDLMYCAAIAQKEGTICKIKDYSVEKGDLNTLEKDILSFRPDIVLVNIASTTFETDIKAVETIKKTDKNITTIVTGAHFLTFNISVLKEHADIDIIIRGEPEITFKEIVQGRDLNEIDGITFRNGDEIKSNKDRQFIEDLDILPFPARDLIKNELYTRPDTSEKQAIIRAAAGCPYNCFFCLATAVSGEKVRYRSPDNIIAEIKECINKYDIRSFVFWSDLFTANKVFVKELCEKLISEDLKIKWSSNSRVDTIDEETLVLMKKAGCTLLSMGIESGSQEILDKIGKKITKEQAVNTVKLCKKHGLQTFTYFVIGLPWETKQNIMETINFAIELDADYVNFYTATVLAGSRMYNYVIENSLGEMKDFYKNPYYYPCVKTHYLSKEEIVKLHKYAVRKFYLRPKYIIKKLKEIKTAEQLKNYFRAGLSVLFKR